MADPPDVTSHHYKSIGIWAGLVVLTWYLIDKLWTYPGLAFIAPIALGVVIAILIVVIGRRRTPTRIAAAFLVGLFVGTQAVFAAGLPFVYFGLLIAGALLVAPTVTFMRRRFAWVNRRSRILVVVAAIVLLVVLAPFAIAQAAVWHTEALSTAGLGTKFIEAAGPPYPPTLGDRLEPARAYRPIHVFDPHEAWRPTPVESFLQDERAKLVTPSGETSARRVLAGPVDECRSLDDGCYVTLHCKKASDECAEEVSDDYVVYVRVVDDPLAKEHRRATKRPLVGLRRLIQYWAFYRYDDWDGWGGLFNQWHEGDWEVVSVGLGARGPLFVAYNSHCGGIWREWKDVAGFAADPGEDPAGVIHPAQGTPPGHHPLIFVGRGSHGAYPDDVPRAPNWTSCTDKVNERFKWATFGPTFGGGVREHLDQYDSSDDDFLGPRVILLRDPLPAFMQFVGRWAEADHLKLLWGDQADKGPKTPTLQSSWTTPLESIFCNPYWRPRGHCPPKNAKTL
jgi:hypothetical protein